MDPARALAGRAADLGRDALAFFPELALAGGVCLLLVLRLVPALDRRHLGPVALAAALAALGVAAVQWAGRLPAGFSAASPAFAGMLVLDPLAAYLRVLLAAAAALTVLLTLVTGIPDAEDSADFHALLLGSTLGLMFMASADHLLMAYLAVEMASLPGYALAGFLKGRRQAGEAALKYVVTGGAASGLLLYGVSLLAGRFGTGRLPDLAAGFAAAPPWADAVVLLGCAFVFAGLAFKLAAVPAHFWCPDVFEGAAAEVAGFLSVASKAAALGLLARLLFVAAPPGTDAAAGFAPLLIAVAALTATVGNLAALGQTNLKRLLAYSTIAHAGYMLMGLSTGDRAGAAAVLVYLAAYLFMNLGAFACVALIRNRTGSEDLADLAGLAGSSPRLVFALGVCLLGLLGLPPLAGFAAKFQVFAAVYDAGQRHAADEGGLGTAYFGLLAVAAANTVASAFYYLKVLKVMALDAPANEPPAGRVPAAGVALVLLLAAGVVGAFFAWGPVGDAAARAAGMGP